MWLHKAHQNYITKSSAVAIFLSFVGRFFFPLLLAYIHTYIQTRHAESIRDVNMLHVLCIYTHSVRHLYAYVVLNRGGLSATAVIDKSDAPPSRLAALSAAHTIKHHHIVLCDATTGSHCGIFNILSNNINAIHWLAYAMDKLSTGELAHRGANIRTTNRSTDRLTGIIETLTVPPNPIIPLTHRMCMCILNEAHFVGFVDLIGIRIF